MKIEVNVFKGCRKKHHRHHAVRGQFAGAFHVNSRGEIIVAQQTVPGSVAETGQLLFKDQNGNPIPGPVGTITSTDSANAPSLSSDGQSYNFTPPAATATDQLITLTWHDPAGKIAAFSTDFVVAAVIVLEAVSGEFGPASPGTTA